MKNIIYIVLFLFVACKSTKKTPFELELFENIRSITVNCPDSGECSIELLPNKSFIVKTDPFGIKYPVIATGDKTLLKFTFNKTPIPNVQDSNYTEIVYAELDRNIHELSLSNKELQHVKLYFGRLCFCRGETGYYPITTGEFKLTSRSKKELKIEIRFKITEVPQIVSNIVGTFLVK